MPIFFWNSRYAIGIPQIDDHHRHLLHLLNKTYDSFITGALQEEIGLLLDELIDYAIYHFFTEERWMREHGYPDSQQHMLEHEQFSLRITEIYDDFCKGKKALSLEVLSFLHTWLATHIMEQDSELGYFYKHSQRASLFEESEPNRINMS